MNEHADLELLDIYVTQRSEEAFRELVRRHIDVIYSAALRQLRNPHLAEEATQSAFIALAAKAGRLNRKTVIAGWLHHAVHFAALNLHRAEARRRHWEEEAAHVNTPPDPEPSIEEKILPHIDHALAQLSASDRDAIVLRFFQQLSLSDVGRALGTSEEAAKKRVSRALERMRRLLVRHGVAVPVAVLAVGLSKVPVTAAPAGLSASVAALAARTAVSPTTSASGDWSLHRLLKAKIVTVTGVLLVTASAAFLWRNHASNPPTPDSTIRIRLTSVLVDDQQKAFQFYTDVLGFVPKRDLPAGDERWLTVGSPGDTNGPELLLEPMGFPPARTYQEALRTAGIPLTAFAVADVRAEYERMTRLGVRFTTKITRLGLVDMVTLDDTCGNLIRLVQPPVPGNTSPPSPRIHVTSVLVDDQDKALRFYTEILGFTKKSDMTVAGGRWLTVVSPTQPDGPELLLEPMGFPPARVYQAELRKAGIPLTAFAVADLQKEYKRLTRLGVKFTTEPVTMGPTRIAVLDDTCGNLIQLFQE